jgi:hypothetical protein
VGRFEVQGIVSADGGKPFVQVRSLDEEGVEEFKMQLEPADARDIAQNLQEAATNAIYEAAIFAWAKERDPKDGEIVGIGIISGIRDFRADRWGISDKPEDWR